MAGLFQVLYGRAYGTFRRAEVLKGTDGEPLTIATQGSEGRDQLTEKICTRPFAVDWDGDGNLDLVVGNFAGTFYWFKGRGKGTFSPRGEWIKAGASPLRITGYHSDPFVIDWDGDGDLDLLSGSSNGGVQWAENRAGKGKAPELSSFQALIKQGPPVVLSGPLFLREADLTGPTQETRVWVDDVNCDGKLDILLGDSVTLVSPAKGVSEEQFKKQFTNWQNAITATVSKLHSAGSDEKARRKAGEEFHQLFDQRAEFMQEERTGFVWLYLQK